MGVCCMVQMVFDESREHPIDDTWTTYISVVWLIYELWLVDNSDYFHSYIDQ